MSDAEVLLDREGPIGRITLNRPAKMNAITDVMLQQLVDAVTECDRDPAVKVSVLSANGENFCAGYDMGGRSSYTQIDKSIQQNLSVIRHMRSSYQAIWNSRKPIIGKVHGYCIAGGCYLQMLCDVTVAAEDARLGHPGVSIGGMTAMPLWSWLVGTRKAKELLMTGKLIDGTEAARIGLVNEAVPADRLDETVASWAEQMCSIPLDGLTLTKEAVNTAAEVMGLGTTFRTQGALSALARTGDEIDPDLSSQRSKITGRGVSDQGPTR